MSTHVLSSFLSSSLFIAMIFDYNVRSFFKQEYRRIVLNLTICSAIFKITQCVVTVISSLNLPLDFSWKVQLEKQCTYSCQYFRYVRVPETDKESFL